MFLQRKTRRARIFFIILGCIALYFIAFAIRYANISRSSLWLDEVLQLIRTTGPIEDIWGNMPQDKPPLDYYIQWLFVHGELVGEARARLHACLISSAVVLALGAWAYYMGGFKLAVVIILLSLANPLFVRFGREGRPYSLLLLAECLFFTAFWSMASAKKPPGTGKWIFLSISVFLCLWSLYWGGVVVILTLVFGFAWLILNPGKIKNVKRALTESKAWLFLIIPLVSALPLIFRSSKAMMEEFPYSYSGDTLKFMIKYLNIYALGYKFNQYQAGGGLILGILAVLGLAGWLVRRKSAPALFCAFIFSSLFFGTFLYYSIIDHWISVRYTLASLPPFLMLSGMGIVSLSLIAEKIFRNSPRLIRRVAGWSVLLIPALVIFGFQLNFVLQNSVNWRNWRKLAKIIKQSATEDTIVMMGDHLDNYVFSYYFDRFQLTGNVVTLNYDLNLAEQIVSQKDDVWIVMRSEEVGKEFHQLLNSMIPIDEPLPFLEVRRNISTAEAARQRRSLNKFDFSQKDNITFSPANNQENYLGKGWAGAEKWDDRYVWGMDGSRAEIILPVKEPVSVEISLSFIAYKPLHEPQLKIKTEINGHSLEEKPVNKKDMTLNWDAPEDLFQPGINVISIVPNRTLCPAEILEDNSDFRELSLWVEEIGFRRKR